MQISNQHWMQTRCTNFQFHFKQICDYIYKNECHCTNYYYLNPIKCQVETLFWYFN